ncbi:hypothetical protein AALO_G00186260 [Alosa alosa]|uniref:Uncharacterized protein n=1 Tax=Alosa alosa TaxID=278164 RepID=A0AAV6GB26_9TELE|nr:hypothetical protein AALO_G00186260 [Alosa alosa]
MLMRKCLSQEPLEIRICIKYASPPRDPSSLHKVPNTSGIFKPLLTDRGQAKSRDSYSHFPAVQKYLRNIFQIITQRKI